MFPFLREMIRHSFIGQPQRVWPRWVALGLIGLGIVFWASLMPAILHPPSSAAGEITLDPVVLQLKWKHQFQFAGYYAAQQQGFYQAAGLDVKLMEAPQLIAEPAQLVLQGKADFGVAASDLLLLRGQGQPVVALAAIFQHSPLVFLALQGGGISSIHDLAHRRVMLEPHAAELLAYLKDEAVPISTITFSPHTFNPLDLLVGQVEAMSAYATDEPFSLQQAGKGYSIFTPRSAGIDFYGDTLFTTEQQIQEHPDRVKKFLEASLQGWDYALAHPEEMVEVIYSQYSQRHSRAHLAFEARQMQSLILPDIVELGYMNRGRWRYIADIYASMGMLRSNLDLVGFLYDRSPYPNFTGFYLALFGLTTVLVIMAAIAARFYQLNRRIAQAMAAKERITAELTTVERQYHILVESAPFAIIISGYSHSQVLYLNTKAAQLFEIAQTHAPSQRVIDYYLYPESREALLKKLDQQGYLYNTEIQLKSATGRIFWASVSATLVEFDQQPAIFTSLVDVSDHKKLEIQLEQMAMTDELTGLFNRRYFTHQGDIELRQAKQTQTPLSVLLLDVDHFKIINDTYGHDAGDYVLCMLATLMQQNLRQVDTLGRLGGEEFSLLLPNTNQDESFVLAERLRQLVAAHPHQLQNQPITITVSIGVTTLADHVLTLDTLLSQADQAMYEAKQRGRNQVVLYRPQDRVPPGDDPSRLEVSSSEGR